MSNKPLGILTHVTLFLTPQLCPNLLHATQKVGKFIINTLRDYHTPRISSWISLLNGIVTTISTMILALLSLFYMKYNHQ